MIFLYKTTSLFLHLMHWKPSYSAIKRRHGHVHFLNDYSCYKHIINERITEHRFLIKVVDAVAQLQSVRRKLSIWLANHHSSDWFKQLFATYLCPLNKEGKSKMRMSRLSCVAVKHKAKIATNGTTQVPLVSIKSRGHV